MTGASVGAMDFDGVLVWCAQITQTAWAKWSAPEHGLAVRGHASDASLRVPAFANNPANQRRAGEPSRATQGA